MKISPRRRTLRSACRSEAESSVGELAQTSDPWELQLAYKRKILQACRNFSNHATFNVNLNPR